MSVIPRPALPALDHCWTCGASDGDIEDFLQLYLEIWFCEPTDHRFDMDRGYQIFCSACTQGRLGPVLQSNSQRRWRLAVTTTAFRVTLASNWHSEDQLI